MEMEREERGAHMGGGKVVDINALSDDELARLRDKVLEEIRQRNRARRMAGNLCPPPRWWGPPASISPRPTG